MTDPRLIPLALSLLLAVAAGCAPSERGGGEAPPAGSASEAPAMRDVDHAGVLDVVRASDARAVLVNVWATWCLPCREEMPDLLRLDRELPDDDFRLVLVSADFDAAREAAREFLAEQGVERETLRKAEKDEAFIDGLNPEWSGALPASFLYDDQGKLQRFWQGKVSYEELSRAVAALAEE